MLRQSLVCAIILATVPVRSGLAITIASSAQGGPNAVALVNVIVDPGSFYSVVSGSQNTNINAAGNPASNPRARASRSGSCG